MDTQSLLSNLLAQRTSRRLNTHATDLASSNERLASGLRINHASDDAASLAVSMSLGKDYRVFSQAIRNINDGVSALSIADGALAQLEEVVSRIKELSTQSANGIFSLIQRRALDKEAHYLSLEFNRLVNTTQFNNLNILNNGGNATRIQLGYGSQAIIDFTMSDELTHKVGNGTYKAKTDVSTSTSSNNPMVGDFNGDGIDDMITSGSNPAQMIYLQGNTNGTFSSTTINISGASSTGTVVGMGDFNSDGYLDFAAYETTVGQVTFLGNGNGTFQSQISAGGNIGNSGENATLDFNNDGKLDYLTRNGGSIYLSLGNGNGTFTNGGAILTAAAGNITNFATGDFNGDGKADIIASNSSDAQINVYSGNGSGGVTSAILASTAGASGSRISVGDFNNDGYDDFAFAEVSAGSAYLTSNGNGTFSSATDLSADGNWSAQYVTVGDVNGDGLLDLVGQDLIGLFTKLGNGDGTFQVSLVNTTTLSGRQPVLGDFNGDGAPDVALAASSNLDVHYANTSNTSYMERFYLLDREGALSSMDNVETVLSRVRNQRGKIGAGMSRLATALSTLQSISTNVAAAASRITDVDIASESANSVRLQILSKTTAALLGQANHAPDIALKLLDFD